jgi:hypothetical protein
MRFRKLGNSVGLGSRLSLTMVIASLFLAAAVRATEMDSFTEKMPRAYFGEFKWDDDKQTQNVAIVFESVRALSDQKAEAVGCGAYEVRLQVTKIKVRMFIRLADLQVDIWESARAGAGFDTDGSHRGNLSEDLQRIDARWTTNITGRRGQLHLRAVSSTVCEPAVSL